MVRDSHRYAIGALIRPMMLFSSFFLVLSLISFCTLVLDAPKASATTSTLSISIDDSVLDFNVGPSSNGTFVKSNPSTISASTNNATGYVLTIAAGDSTDNYNKLVGSKSGNEDTINSLDPTTYPHGVEESAFKALDATAYNNMWGYLSYKKGSASTTFLSSPGKGTEESPADTIAKTECANNTTNCPSLVDEYELVMGARVDSTINLDSYSNTYIVALVANAIPYSITYIDNTITSMPVDISGTSPNETITISSSTPTRNGYSFLGWCNGAVVNNANGTDTCTGATVAAGGTITIDQTSAINDIALYAMWGGNYTISGITYMQDFATMSAEKKAKVLMSMVEGQRYELTDNRDQDTYYVAKLKDGNVWMLDNLRLGGSSIIALTPNDTNIQNNYTLPASTTDFDTFVSPRIDASLKNNTNVTSYGQGSGKVGVYYNECAASAGTYCYADGAGVDIANTIFDAPNDVCPVGWRRPTGGAVNNGEFKVLYEAYSNNGADFNNAFSSLLSGNASGYYFGQYGFFKSASYCNGSRMCDMSVGPGGSVNIDNWQIRNDGQSIRCILK